MRFWSVSTTIRNSERIRSFLQVLKIMEGEKWDKESQKKFQILLIKERVYGYNSLQFYKSLTQNQINIINNISSIITFKQAKDIFYTKNYEDPPMRGRQSYNPLEKMGLTYLDGNKNIVISDFGNYFLQEDYDLGEVFLKSFLKWQYPNPDTNKYKEEDGYNIKPFIASLHLINEVNIICKKKEIKVKGISRLEFALFVVSLINYKDIIYK